MSKKRIAVLPHQFTVHRLGAKAEIPAVLVSAKHCWIARTKDELSVVCEDSIVLDSERSETGWKCLGVCGPLEFSEIGITANISTELARAGISMVGLATFDTDYFLVKADQLTRACRALEQAGWEVTTP